MSFLTLAVTAASLGSGDYIELARGDQAALTPIVADLPAAISVDAPPLSNLQPRASDAVPQVPARTNEDYRLETFLRQSASIPWRVAGATAAITVTGVANWNWGSSEFHFSSEGWFGEDTANGGMDKLGHGYTSYVLTEFFTDGIAKKSQPGTSSSITAAILAMGLMTYIEVFDGFSKDHGFSTEDLAADAAGAVFSIARRAVKGLRDKVDFRLLYLPTKETVKSLSCFPRPQCARDGATARSPITAYAEQRYIMALKLSGFDVFRKTPLRLIELHGGYYARGFTAEEQLEGDRKKRRLFMGVGLNVSELLFAGKKTRGVASAVKSVLEYVQIPYTAVHSD